MITDSLNQMAVPGSRRSAEQRVAPLLDEAPGGQFVNVTFLDRGIKTPIEFFQTLQLAKRRRFDTPGELTILADQHFILQNQFQELDVRQVVAAGFLQTNFQRLGQARESKFLQRSG